MIVDVTWNPEKNKWTIYNQEGIIGWGERVRLCKVVLNLSSTREGTTSHGKITGVLMAVNTYTSNNPDVNVNMGGLQDGGSCKLTARFSPYNCNDFYQKCRQFNTNNVMLLESGEVTYE